MRILEGFLVIFLIGLGVGVLLGSVITVKASQEAKFREKIEQHNCQPISIWRSGQEVKDSACRLPDGTIIEK